MVYVGAFLEKQPNERNIRVSGCEEKGRRPVERLDIDGDALVEQHANSLAVTVRHGDHKPESGHRRLVESLGVLQEHLQATVVLQ